MINRLVTRAKSGRLFDRTTCYCYHLFFQEAKYAEKEVEGEGQKINENEASSSAPCNRRFVLHIFHMNFFLQAKVKIKSVQHIFLSAPSWTWIQSRVV